MIWLPVSSGMRSTLSEVFGFTHAEYIFQLPLSTSCQYKLMLVQFTLSRLWCTLLNLSIMDPFSLVSRIVLCTSALILQPKFLCEDWPAKCASICSCYTSNVLVRSVKFLEVPWLLSISPPIKFHLPWPNLIPLFRLGAQPSSWGSEHSPIYGGKYGEPTSFKCTVVIGVQCDKCSKQFYCQFGNMRKKIHNP